MKKLLIILSIILFTSCEEDKYAKRAPTHADICITFLEQRNDARFNGHPDQVTTIDSMFIKCGCDSLK